MQLDPSRSTKPHTNTRGSLWWSGRRLVRLSQSWPMIMYIYMWHVLDHWWSLARIKLSDRCDHVLCHYRTFFLCAWSHEPANKALTPADRTVVFHSIMDRYMVSSDSRCLPGPAPYLKRLAPSSVWLEGRLLDDASLLWTMGTYRNSTLALICYKAWHGLFQSHVEIVHLWLRNSYLATTNPSNLCAWDWTRKNLIPSARPRRAQDPYRPCTYKYVPH